MTTGYLPTIQALIKTLIIVSLLPATLLMNGCVSQSEVPQDYFYRLPTVHPDSPLESKLIKGTISVDQLAVDGVYRERPLLYVDAQRPLEVLQYHYRHWIQVPSQLIQDNLVDYLREANVADSVDRYSSGRRQDLLIRGRLQKFEQLVSEGSSTAVVEVEIEFRKKSQQGMVNLTKVYESQVSAQGSAIHDSVTAFGEALRKIYDKILVDLKGMDN
jgi:ABC-type uncharacterized transport system auxiliary subunit